MRTLINMVFGLFLLSSGIVPTTVNSVARSAHGTTKQEEEFVSKENMYFADIRGYKFKSQQELDKQHKNIVQDHKLYETSDHYDIEELRDKAQDRIESAKAQNKKLYVAENLYYFNNDIGLYNGIKEIKNGVTNDKFIMLTRDDVKTLLNKVTKNNTKCFLRDILTSFNFKTDTLVYVQK